MLHSAKQVNFGNFRFVLGHFRQIWVKFTSGPILPETEIQITKITTDYNTSSVSYFHSRSLKKNIFKQLCQIKLCRGEFCVANFIPPANGAS